MHNIRPSLIPSHLKTLHFIVADCDFTIKTTEAARIKRLLPSYAPFYTEKPGSDSILVAEIINGEVSTDSAGEELGQFDCGGTNHGVYRLKDGYKFVISNPGNQFCSAMIANSDFSHCTISTFGNEPDQRFGLGNAMMIAFAFSAARHNVLLMHASVTTHNGKGYLFLGKSGTGKSTHSSLWRKHIPGAGLLNDDNPALRTGEDGSVTVYGTPWSGKTPCYRNKKMPVGAITRLEQWPENIIHREERLRAFASVLSSCSTMVWDAPSYKAIADTVSKVAMAVPVFYLKCLPDEAAARLCHQTITNP